MEIVQEIGSYAGFAAVVGLAILSALYFSQARDVKRLREWAGRAPDRAPTPQVPAASEPRGVVAQPIAKPASRPIPGGTPPPVPRPPGAQPATPGAAPAAASAAGAAPAIARGPAPATPAGAGAAGADDDEDQVLETGEHEVDVTQLDTEIHPPPEPLPGDGEDQPDGVEPGEGEIDEGPADVAADGAEESTGDYAPVDSDATAVYESGDTGEHVALDPDEELSGEIGEGDALDEDDPQETGEWRPEDEHSDIDFTDERDAVGPATPVGASAPRPPTPPRPYQRRGAPGAATGYARDRAGTILPPYEESRPGAEADDDPGGGRRRWPLIAAAALAIVAVAFGVMQLTGSDDPSGGADDAGLSAGGSGGGGGSGSGDGGGGSDAPPVDPADVTVAVLNGTTVPGLAATIGDKVVNEGFQLGTVTNNFDQEKAESVVLYSPGSEREAADVARRLDISQREAIDAESQALAGDATVVVVAGADQNQ